MEKAGVTHEQATGTVGVLESWEMDWAVSRDCLGARTAEVHRDIADAKAELEGWFLT